MIMGCEWVWVLDSGCRKRAQRSGVKACFPLQYFREPALTAAGLNSGGAHAVFDSRTGDTATDLRGRAWARPSSLQPTCYDCARAWQLPLKP